MTPKTTKAPLRITPEAMPRPAQGIFANILDGEITLYDEATDHVRLLNPTASVIWQLCDGTRTVHDLIEDVAAVYSKPTADIEAETSRMLAEFASGRLIEDARTSAPSPSHRVPRG